MLTHLNVDSTKRLLSTLSRQSQTPIFSSMSNQWAGDSSSDTIFCSVYDVIEDVSPGESDEQQAPRTFTPVLYANIGRQVLITILDVCEKNPFSRVFSSGYHSMESVRRAVGWECVRLERFRIDPFAYKKARRCA